MNFNTIIVHSDAYDAAVSIPVHPKRHLITWDLVSHYALGDDPCRYHHAAETSTGSPEISEGGTGVTMVPSSTVRVLDPFDPTTSSECSRAPDVNDVLPLLLEFHDSDYVQYVRDRSISGALDERHRRVHLAGGSVKRPREEDDGSVASQRYANDLVPEEGDDEYGLTNECHPYRGMFQTALYTVWGTVYSVRALTIQPQLPSSPLGTSSTRSIKANSSSGGNDGFVWCAMHWWGGRHHAKCDKAGGFCYFNDVVIGVQELQKRLRQRSSCRVSSSPRILVLDIDAHHGDGTQDAFFHDPSVFTCSLHRYGVGVFPGSGRTEERGGGFGKGTCSNIPLKEGSTGAAALPVIVSEIHKIWASFAPDAAVIVCGADALVGDPLGGLNFDVGDLQTIVRLVMEKCWANMKDGHATVPTPLLILGAGGYVDTSFAKVAAAVTKDVAYWTGPSSKGSSGGWEGKESPPLLSSAITCDRTPPLTTTTSTTEKTLCDDANRPTLATTTTLMVPVPDTCEYFSLYAPSFLMGGLPPAVCQKITSDGLCVPEGDTGEASFESESCEEEDSDEEVIDDM